MNLINLIALFALLFMFPPHCLVIELILFIVFFLLLCMTLHNLNYGAFNYIAISNNVFFSFTSFNFMFKCHDCFS